MDQSTPLPPGLYRQLFEEAARPHLANYFWVALLLLIVSLTTASMAWLVEDVVDGVFAQEKSSQVALLAGTVFAIFTVRGLSTYGSTVLLARIGNQIVATLQERTLRHLQQQNLHFYETHTLGDVAIRFSANATAARSAIELIVQSIGRDAVTLIGLVAVMTLQNVKMVLIGSLVLLPSVFVIRHLTAKARRIGKDTIAANSRMLGQVREMHQGIRAIKAFTLEPQIAKRLLSEVRKIRDLSNAGVKYAALTAPALDIIIGFLVMSMIILSGWQLASGDVNPGSIVSFLTALLLAYEPARRLARFQVQLQAHMVGVEMIFDFLDQSAGEATDKTRSDRELGRHYIQFHSVCLRHGETAVVQNLSLECCEGKVTAIVGASGAGKSTLVDLLLGLRKTDQGAVRIGDVEIGQLSLRQLRKTIAIVPQQIFLFDNTIRENIRWGRPDATDAEVEAAAKAANAHDFILGEPEGYDRWITDSAGLSGGERQRIAIARALLKDAPILVLDEATAALDPFSETQVQQALASLAQGRTTLVIAHRLSSVRHADQIHVLENGRVVESGTHAELISKNGIYAHLYGAQALDG